MKSKPLRLWAYHAEWIVLSTNFAMLPDHRTPLEMRLVRRANKKHARRLRRKLKRAENGAKY